MVDAISSGGRINANLRLLPATRLNQNTAHLFLLAVEPSLERLTVDAK